MLGSGDTLRLTCGTEARVALILSDENGRLFALTSRDFITEVDNQIFYLESGQARLAGEIGERPCSDHTVWQGTRSLAWFAIDKRVSVRAEDLARFGILNPEAALNQDVVFEGQGSQEFHGYVRRTAASLKVRYSDKSSLSVNGRILEVTPKTGFERFGAVGDAGSLVYSTDGRILGALIGFRGSRTLVAPIYDLLKAETFQIANLDQISAHNAATENETIEQQILRLINRSERKWWRCVRELAPESNTEFSLLRNTIGLSAMEQCQDQIAVSIYQQVGAVNYIDGLLKLHFENDAPGNHSNENWLWRATFERLQLLSISPNLRSFHVLETGAEICPVSLAEDQPVVSPVEQYRSRLALTRKEYKKMSIQEKAKTLFGDNIVPTDRALDWTLD